MKVKFFICWTMIIILNIRLRWLLNLSFSIEMHWNAIVNRRNHVQRKILKSVRDTEKKIKELRKNIGGLTHRASEMREMSLDRKGAPPYSIYPAKKLCENPANIYFFTLFEHLLWPALSLIYSFIHLFICSKPQFVSVCVYRNKKLAFLLNFVRTNSLFFIFSY